MPDNVSALPSAMQARRQQLESQDAPTDPPANAIPENPSSVSTSTETRITVSREEFNDLQAAADRAAAAEGRAEALRLDVEALTQRLTDLETASKGNPNPVAPTSADAWQPTTVEYTEDDIKDYGESKSFVQKVVKEVLNTELPKLLSRLTALEETVNGVKTLAEGASKTASTIKSKSYTDQVREKVGNFDECVNHKHWQDFTKSQDPDTGYAYAELIENNFNRENVSGMVRVFTKFKEKYGVGEEPKPSGYEGGMPSGSGVDTEIDTSPKMLPFSARRAAHKQYINKEISFEEYETIRKKYDDADREGRVDYNK